MNSCKKATYLLVGLVVGLSACGEANDSLADESYYANNGANNNGYYDQGANNGSTPINNGSSIDERPDYQDGETYEEWVENDFIDSATENTSTFSIDVDNASYTLMRRDLNNGTLPVAIGVRPEEYINYFDYAYPDPMEGSPFSINLEVAPSAFGDNMHLLRVGLQGERIHLEDLKPTNLVFLVDVSGSMQSSAKLPLVQASLRTVVDNLRSSDRVAIVTYAGADRVVLDSTAISEKAQIMDAINNLKSGGSTNADAGIVRAYQIAEDNFIEDGNNRVMIMTDGDFNVGRTGSDLVDLMISYREKFISLTSVGYGLGNFNDAIMESLARDGNGNYFYIDSENEAERIFGDDLPSTLEVIAADVKIQVEFHADTVKRYRLIGYENRILDNEDFRDDTKDAGEIGPGHSVTALYEIELLEESTSTTGMLSEVRIRHKSQYGVESTEYSHGIKQSQIQPTFAGASADFQFAASVAEFAEILRESKHSSDARLAEVRTIAEGASSPASMERMEFLDLVDKAISLQPAN